MERKDITYYGKRLDVFLADMLKQKGRNLFSRSFLKEKWGKLVSVNGKFLKPSYKIQPDDKVEIYWKEIDELEESLDNNIGIQAEEGYLNILFENEQFLVLEKEKGIVVHPGIGNRNNTLANRVKGYLEKKGEFDERLNRAGVVHRLDKGVSGLIVFAKTVESQKHLQRQFEEHKVRKLYLAEILPTKREQDLKILSPGNNLGIKKEIENLVKNNFECNDTWYYAEGYIGRSSRNRVKMEYSPFKKGNYKRAISYIKGVDKDRVLVVIRTGRMHQIRATLDFLGLCIKGDVLYGKKKGETIPDKIALESVFLGFEDLNGKTFSFSKF